MSNLFLNGRVFPRAGRVCAPSTLLRWPSVDSQAPEACSKGQRAWTDVRAGDCGGLGRPSLDFVTQTVLKKYCSLIHGQPVIEATLDLRRSNDLRPTDVDHVRCDIFQAGYDFAGGGSYGSKDHPWLKEQGDYNLKYLISAALLDGQVGPDQLDAVRIQAPAAQAMVARVEVRPDDALTARFPQELAARITVRAKGGSTLVKEHIGYEGGLDQPMSWDRVVEKFHWLSEPFADEKLRTKLINSVQHLDTKPISALMDLLAHVWPTAVYPRTRAGI